MTKKIKTYLPYISGIAISFIFGFSFMFTKDALNASSPFTLIANRFFLAGIFAVILILLKIVKVDYKNKNLLPLLFLSLCEPVGYFIFETYGIKLTNSSISGIMIALIPVMTLIIGSILFKHKYSLIQWIFVLFAVIGAMIITFSGGISAFHGGLFKGVLLLLGAVICASCYSLINKTYAQGFSTTEITFFMMWIAAIFFGILSVTENKGFSGYLILFENLSYFGAIFYLGIISSVVAFFCCNYMIANVSIPVSAVFNNLCSVISVFAGVFIRHENFSFLQAIGTIIILIGIFGVSLINYNEKTKNNITENNKG